MDHVELRELDIPLRLADFSIEPGKTALMIIDMYNRATNRNFGFGKRAKEIGVEKELDYYYHRLEKTVIPNLSRLLNACRDEEIEVIHVTIGSLTLDGRDAGWRYRSYKMLSRGIKELEIIEPLLPLPNEIVIKKTTSSAFSSTRADRILRNLGIEYLIIGGVVSGNCVESTVRDGCDRDFKIYILEDACAGLTEESHQFSMSYLHRNYAIVKNTQEVLSEIDQKWKSKPLSQKSKNT